jgi:transmembrane sensor
MNTTFAPGSPSRPHWLIESQAEGFDQHLALERWLAADHEHQRAWAHIQQVVNPAPARRGLAGGARDPAGAALPARRRALKALLLVGVASATGLGLQQHNPLPG